MSTALREAGRFAEALRPGLMGPRLSAALGGGQRPCHVLDAKYEPGKRAVVLYGHGPDLVRGDLVRGDLVRDDVPAAASADGHPVVPPGVRLAVYPHDPDLPWLARAADPATLADLLDHGVGCRVRLLRYRPGKRVTLLVQTRPAGAAFVAKVYHDPAKAAAVATEARELARTGPADVLRLAAPAGHLPELALVLQHAVRGRPVDALLRDADRSAATRSAVRLAGAALAELHQHPVVSRRERPVGAELLRFGQRAARIATVDPAAGAALNRLADRLLATRAAVPAGAPGLVHGDCKPSQFVVAADGVVLLDLDHVGVADPAADVGTFLASLRQLAVRLRLAAGDSGRADRLAALGEQFLAGYLATRDDPTMPARARWYEAVALERKALRAFARATRSPLPHALVVAAHERLDGLGGMQ